MRNWVKRAEIDTGVRDGVTSEERKRIKDLERENRHLRQANEILKKGETIFRHWSEDNGRTLILRRRRSTTRFGNNCLHQRTSRCLRGQAIDCAIGSSDNGGPICSVLQITPSTFYAHLAVERDPDKASDRAKRDAELRPEIKRVWEENLEVYGARKLWHADSHARPRTRLDDPLPLVQRVGEGRRLRRSSGRGLPPD